MAGTDVKVPRLAESISEGVLVAWLRQDGEVVKADEPIATLETDKAAVEIPADRGGVLRHARKVGDTVEVGDVIARIEEGAGAETSAAPRGDPARAAPAEARPRPETRQPESPKVAEPERAPPAEPDDTRRTASSRPLASAEPRRSPPREPAPVAPPRPSTKTAGGPRRLPEEIDGLSPAVRRMVEEFGLDPNEIEGSGKGGRLLKEDVQHHLERRSGVGPERAPDAAHAGSAGGAAPEAGPPRGAAARGDVEAERASAPPAPGTPSVEPWREGEVERAVPMSRIRQRIAERLVQAQQTAAILTTFNEVDMGPVMDLRARFRESFERRHGVKLSYMSFFTRACVLALQQVPEIHAEIRGGEILYQRHVHMGIAVQTDRGLVVPVVRHADQRSFAEIEKEIARLALAARDHRLMLDELSGGTFTISNGGVFGSLLSTPILNPPQSGILGMHKIEKRPVVVDEQIVVRPMMYLALSYDHRIVDGEQAVTFLVSVKERLEDPERMLIEV